MCQISGQQGHIVRTCLIYGKSIRNCCLLPLFTPLQVLQVSERSVSVVETPVRVSAPGDVVTCFPHSCSEGSFGPRIPRSNAQSSHWHLSDGMASLHCFPPSNYMSSSSFSHGYVFAGYLVKATLLSNFLSSNLVVHQKHPG